MKRLLLATCLLLLFAAACAGGGGIVVEDVKANLTLPSTTGAVYMTITNESDEDDALVRADIPGCGSVELHQMKMDGDVMVMQQVPGGEIPIPSGETVELMQGGLHVMCIDKTGTFELGDTVGVTLEFAKAGRVQVDADIVAPGK